MNTTVVRVMYSTHKIYFVNKAVLKIFTPLQHYPHSLPSLYRVGYCYGFPATEMVSLMRKIFVQVILSIQMLTNFSFC